MKMWRCAAAAATAAGLLAGCGQSGPKLAPVSGTVTLNGKPLEGALVSFQPDPSVKDGIPVTLVTGPDGTYDPSSQGRSGILPGKYRVVVTKSLIDPSKVRPEFKDDPFMAQLSMGPMAEKTPAQRKKEQLEGTFEREITAEGGAQDFELTSKSK